ncbi:hypothetical protein FACS1894206_01790 [Deltaproteobacteria bacterium]|nr:hypothetical protein FACS1894206_01790 [Deltaproteobacteria bacterium]
MSIIDAAPVLSLVAVASGDGLDIDQHFGQAKRFLIYAVDRNGFELVEDRIVTVEAADHEAGLEQRSALLSDCRLVLVARIGPGAAAALKRKGLDVLAVTGSIEARLRRLIAWRWKGEQK